MAEYRPKGRGLERVLGTGALFSTANVRTSRTSCRSASRVSRRWLENVFAGRCSRFCCSSLGYGCRARPPAQKRVSRPMPQADEGHQLDRGG